MTISDYDAAKLDAMVTGYRAYWDCESVDVLLVEHEFTRPLVDDLGCESPHWALTGRIDLVIRRQGRVQIVDHKTDGGDGSSYGKRAVLSGQVGLYFEAADSLGLHAEEFVFDVLVKPGQEPLLATPIEKRKYTKGTKKKPSRLHATQRLEDETPEEHATRCAAAIAASPLDYYPQHVIPRVDADQVDFRRTLWCDAEVIDFVERRQLWGQNHDACHRYGSPCDYWQVCSGSASIDDPNVYAANDYAERFGKRVLSNSSRSCFNACRMKYRYQFGLKRSPLRQANALTFGTEAHRLIEEYWKERMNGRSGSEYADATEAHDALGGDSR